MEGVREFLERLRQHGLVEGHFIGLLHIIIGRRISHVDGRLLSAGLTWRQLSELLKIMRWDKEQVREVGLNPDDLPPRDRQRYWYAAIVAAKVDSNIARAAGDTLGSAGFKIGLCDWTGTGLKIDRSAPDKSKLLLSLSSFVCHNVFRFHHRANESRHLLLRK